MSEYVDEALIVAETYADSVPVSNGDDVDDSDGETELEVDRDVVILIVLESAIDADTGAVRLMVAELLLDTDEVVVIV